MTESDGTGRRGQVGIGTLVVFIAMVLVAAIAAGVLLNTAGLLQSKGERTGSESVSSVSDGIRVVSTLGTDIRIDHTGGRDRVTVTRLRLLIRPTAGADPIDTENVTVGYTSTALRPQYRTTTLVSGNPLGPDEGTTPSFHTYTTSGADATVLGGTHDMLNLTIPLQYHDGGTLRNTFQPGALAGGDEATLHVVTAAGSKRTVRIRIPRTLGRDDTAVTL
ncbi:archaellin/type IV pilin N-terminal domain-containing protein [Halorussus caseinilyticus]|uniref:archaellin/type IV pilin N-terminal domain-containing protein n=1 Tax=Halorussus caseinilyticus TaxID=3034025 RepID=UPI0023E84BB3|nr:archaellin/type IV pilin N-terminal domain-containing protein [Halorussus sp. DT72]